MVSWHAGTGLPVLNETGRLFFTSSVGPTAALEMMGSPFTTRVMVVFSGAVA